MQTQLASYDLLRLFGPPWRIEWGEPDSIATYSSGVTFYVSRLGHAGLKDDAGYPLEKLPALLRELGDILSNVAKKGDAIH